MLPFPKVCDCKNDRLGCFRASEIGGILGRSVHDTNHVQCVVVSSDGQFQCPSTASDQWRPGISA